MRQLTYSDCSGLLGRTSLRPQLAAQLGIRDEKLFRPSRPDFIETSGDMRHTRGHLRYCSGLLGRTSLRLPVTASSSRFRAYCSGLLGRTSLRHEVIEGERPIIVGLFRPSRPDFIETSGSRKDTQTRRAGLFRPSRPDFIETQRAGAHTRACARLFRPSRPDFIETDKNRPALRYIYLYCSGLLGRTSLRLFDVGNAVGPVFIVPAF